MATIYSGRYAARSIDPFVVFIIGMRINQPLALRSWTRVAAAMGPMLTELRRNPELGLLHAEPFFYWPGVALVQYWRSFEHLHDYAHARDAAHLPAWAEFNRRVGDNGAVGIWHETYIVNPGQVECIYANMPRFGLARAAEHIPAVGHMRSARTRMGHVEGHPIQKDHERSERQS